MLNRCPVYRLVALFGYFGACCCCCCCCAVSDGGGGGGIGGDGGLELYEFFEAVVMLAFHRANTKFGTVGHFHEANAPLPGCLATLLKQHLLTKAKTDTRAKLKQVEAKLVEAS